MRTRADEHRSSGIRELDTVMRDEEPLKHSAEKSADRLKHAVGKGSMELHKIPGEPHPLSERS